MSERKTRLNKEWIEKYFPIVPVSQLSVDDKFLKYYPMNKYLRSVKKTLKYYIEEGAEDFRVQMMDPAIDENGHIFYEEGKLPCKGKHSGEWWQENAKKVCPEKESRLGTTREWVLFLGVILKYLTENKGYSARKAWKILFKKPKKYLGLPSKEYDLCLTGSFKIMEWYDLGNTVKIITGNQNRFEFYVVGTFFKVNRALGEHICTMKRIHPASIGWIVMKV